ncbi:MAG: UDP-N-acetylmuramoyl-L-alanyl-D-glutamate--2,6-diaminopimelate ligase [Planctomycetaceae bacterium]|nr:UDP-N-acetylmuramoyl-L-alanyl-D-glutamate--2,6-diaminopimelate ligase [Planctomycetaceae bacterium]
MSLSPGTIAVSIRSLIPSASFVDCADVFVTSIQSDSRCCQPGDLFAVVSGTRECAEKYVPEAIQKGAKAVLTERPLTGLQVPQCIVPDVRKVYALLCSELAGRPARRLETVGVTGTNGKTTVSWLVRSILQNSGRRTGLSGTVEYHDGVSSRPASLTTPDANVLSQLLAEMVCRKTTHAVMEVSSHALDQSRLAGTALAVGVITNVTQDHFDYHQNFGNYAACKVRLIQHVKPEGTVVLNWDDTTCRSFASQVKSSQRLLTYSVEGQADVVAQNLQESTAGARFEIQFNGDSVPVRTSLIGTHNISNCLAAAAACLSLGLSLTEIAAGIEKLAAVPGRMERVACGQSFTVLIDYAHTDDALSHVIRSAKQLCSGRVFCVFGAGGDRDTAKRRLLGLAGSEADRVIITSDNPRSEDPEQIIHAIAEGCRAKGVSPEQIIDRREAIHHALSEASAGDLVLIAGKGHENEQIIGDQIIPFSDQQVVENYFRKKRIENSHKVPA